MEILNPISQQRYGVFYFNFHLNAKGGRDGIIWENQKCGEGRGNFPICPRDHFNYFCLFYPWGLSVGAWIDRGGIYPYEPLWILTLKRIHAEGLQQGSGKKRIGYFFAETWVKNR
ncbi:MAG: hypothetical protein AMJ94_08315 [Deltaproteobacteria bacterium SM23_61]|nr:MAG: hypothetical protein AMJ94_08315 [Deltaproteobacteria bacterium SM23_61]